MRFSSTFPTTVGIEYTFVPDFYVRNCSIRRRVASYACAVMRHNPYLPVKTREKITIDHNALEIRSPIHRDVEHMRAFANNLITQATCSGLTPRHTMVHRNGDETFVGTGGGHVHIGIPKGLPREVRVLLRRNIAIDSFNRPELHWFFQEWHDNEGLPRWVTPVHKDKDVIDKLDILMRKVRTYVPIAWRACTPNCGRTQPTLEFRLFDAPRDTSMVERNVDFALAYTMHMCDLAKRGVVVRLKKRQVLNRAKLTPEQVKMKLKLLFAKLQLRYADYHDTYWPNYETRREHGTL